MSTRTNFHSSEFIRCLADLAIADATGPGNAFAEKLGQWIHVADAIALSAVHNDSAAGPPELPPDARAAARAAAEAEFGRTRAFLLDSIMKSCTPGSGKSPIPLPQPEFDLPMDLAAAYAPYRRFYEAHQRDMELRIRPLRIHVREAVAKASPRLGKLADLDAVLEKILRDRESRLLAKVPLLLRERFGHLFREYQRRLPDARQADDPAGWTRADGWLTRFCSDMKTLLLAEAQLRLQPTLGLIEAFNQDRQ